MTTLFQSALLRRSRIRKEKKKLERTGVSFKIEKSKKSLIVGNFAFNCDIQITHLISFITF